VILKGQQHSLIKVDQMQVQFENVDFVIKTQLQIQKDFASIGAQFLPNFSIVALGLDDLTLTIANKLGEIMQEDHRLLAQLFYQIDLPENDELKFENEETYLTEMASLIIRREAYKVYLRSKF